MKKNIIIGLEDESGYYVQACCGEEHLGNSCDCTSYGEGLSKEVAIMLAEEKSKELNIPIVSM